MPWAWQNRVRHEKSIFYSKNNNWLEKLEGKNKDGKKEENGGR
jgi:hypothetical protein